MFGRLYTFTFINIIMMILRIGVNLLSGSNVGMRHQTPPTESKAGSTIGLILAGSFAGMAVAVFLSDVPTFINHFRGKFTQTKWLQRNKINRTPPKFKRK